MLQPALEDTKTKQVKIFVRKSRLQSFQLQNNNHQTINNTSNLATTTTDNSTRAYGETTKLTMSYQQDRDKLQQVSI